MELLHTKEEISILDKKFEMASELTSIGAKYTKEFGDDITNGELMHIIMRIENEIVSELDKYQQFVGRECLAPPAPFSKDNIWRKGRIEEITHFNNFSRSVRVRFRYDSAFGGGSDGHSLLELKSL